MDEQELMAKIRQIRSSRRSGPYPHAVREAVVAFATPLVAQGLSVRVIGRRLGLQATTVRHWLITASRTPQRAPQLVPVVAKQSAPTPGSTTASAQRPTSDTMTIRFPSGAVIEGVDLATVATLLRNTR